MTDDTGHPILLPWYVAGTLDAGESGIIESHLGGCEECRAEIEALRSMRHSLVQHLRTDHPSAEEIVLHAEGRIPEDGRERIEAHIRECEPCAEESGVLNRLDSGADRHPPAAVRGPYTQRKGWMLLASAAGVVFLVTLGIVMTRQTAAPGIRSAELALLMPAQRDGGSTPVLLTEGPWMMRVVLPSRAPGGHYRVEVVSDSGDPVASAAATLPALADGSLELLLGTLPGAGRYRLVLHPQVETEGTPYIYVFERSRSR